MDFNLTDERQMLRDGAERFLTENYSFEDRRGRLGLENGCDEETWQSFAELGWLGLTLPEEAGGLGAGLIEATLLGEAIGRHLVIEPVATSGVLCARIIERSTGAADTTSLLAAIGEGSLRLALACLEPGERCMLAHPACRVAPAGDGFVLNGTKMLVLDAPAAHRCIVSAAIDGRSGYALFVVDVGLEGVVQRGYPLVDGRRASDFDFNDVRLPGSALLCEPSTAHDVLDEALDRYRVVQVADALGAMEALLEVTAEHLRNRKQFGQPLAAFQALQHRMAEMFVEVQETRSALYHALAHFDAGPAVRNAAVSSAKVVASEAGRVIGGQGIQLHGGVGMTDEYQVGHFFKRLLVLEKSAGDLDYHLDRMARMYG